MNSGPDPRSNPYAPPAAAVASPAGAAGSYETERQPVWVLILLSVVTLGVYAAVWYFLRARFLDSLAADKKMGRMPVGYLVATVVNMLLAVVIGVIEPATDPTRGIGFAVGIYGLVVSFRVAHILRSDFCARGEAFAGLGRGGVFLRVLLLAARDQSGGGDAGAGLSVTTSTYLCCSYR